MSREKDALSLSPRSVDAIQEVMGISLVNDVQRLTVDEFIAARGYIERQLKGANPRSSADFSGAAERLMKLGIIDFRAVDRLVNPAPGLTGHQLSEEAVRPFTIDSLTGRWMSEGFTLTHEQSLRIAASVLPGISEEQLSLFYDETMFDGPKQ